MHFHSSGDVFMRSMQLFLEALDLTYRTPFPRETGLHHPHTLHVPRPFCIALGQLHLKLSLGASGRHAVWPGGYDAVLVRLPGAKFSSGRTPAQIARTASPYRATSPAHPGIGNGRGASASRTLLADEGRINSNARSCTATHKGTRRPYIGT
jgi:hypothetical protein